MASLQDKQRERAGFQTEGLQMPEGNCIGEHHSAPQHSLLSRQLLQFFLYEIFQSGDKTAGMDCSGCRVESSLACWGNWKGGTRATVSHQSSAALINWCRAGTREFE